MYFIDYLYEAISKKNQGVESKVNKLFSKFYHTIAADADSSEMKIFARIMTYTDYGKHDLVNTYITVRTLLFRGFRQTIKNDSILNKFQINKDILKVISNFVKLDYDGVKNMLKEVLQGRVAYGDDLMLAILDFIHKEKNNNTLDDMAKPVGDTNINWEDQIKKYHEIKFNYQLIKDQSMSNTKISAKIIYRVMTDEF